MNDDVVEDDIPKSEDVHVHLSDRYQIKYNHLLTWFLPQLKAKDSNVLVSYLCHAWNLFTGICLSLYFMICHIMYVPTI